MSWAEVKKINSDFVNEPLNFNNYINDISVFGLESYVLDTQNESLYRGLLSNSLTVFGHKAIHEVIYSRMTPDDIDYMFVTNGRLGQALNSFYRCELFSKGGIDRVLKELTLDAYHTLEIKLQQGINRYIESYVGNNTGVGEWIDRIFNLDHTHLKSKQTLAEIVNDTNLLNELITNPSILLVLCCNASLMAIDMQDTTFKTLLITIASSTPAMLDLLATLNAQDKLTAIFNDDQAVQIIANSVESMNAVVQYASGFITMVNSEVAMPIMAESTIAQDVIINAMESSARAEAVIANVNENMNSIITNMDQLVSGVNVLDSLNTLSDCLNQTTTKVNAIMNKSDVVIANIKRLLESQIAMEQIIKNKLVFERITNNALILNLVMKSIVGKKIYFDSPYLGTQALYDKVVAHIKDTNYYTKSAQMSVRNISPVADSTNKYFTNHVIEAKPNTIYFVDYIYANDTTNTDSGGSGPYTVTLSDSIKQSGTITGSGYVTTTHTINKLGYQIHYTAEISGSNPRECKSNIYYYEYTAI